MANSNSGSDFLKRVVYTVVYGIIVMILTSIFYWVFNMCGIMKTDFTFGWAIGQFIGGVLVLIMIQICYPKKFKAFMED